MKLYLWNLKFHNDNHFRTITIEFESSKIIKSRHTLLVFLWHQEKLSENKRENTCFSYSCLCRQRTKFLSHRILLYTWSSVYFRMSDVRITTRDKYEYYLLNLKRFNLRKNLKHMILNCTLKLYFFQIQPKMLLAPKIYHIKL